MEIGDHMRLDKGKETVLVIPDLQIPFHHKDAFKFLDYIKGKVKPTKVVCIGDSIDSHALSDYISNPDGFSAGHEHTSALTYLKDMYNIFPEGVEVDSNHNNRIFRRACSAGIPKTFLRSYKEFMNAPESWEFVPHIIIDDIMYEHGDSFTGQIAAKSGALANMRSTVIGHHHNTASIHYMANKERMLFGMNVGCLIDNEAYAFEYNKKNKTQPTLACGVVDKGVPILYPLILNSKGRWIGRV
jgi:hypothetical protein